MTNETLISLNENVVGYKVADNGRRYPVTVSLEFRIKEGKVELALTGHAKGPYGAESFGQIYDHLKEDIDKFEWPEEEVDRLIEIWKRWHLNSLNAGCPHQREMKRVMIESGAVKEEFFHKYGDVLMLDGFASCPNCADGYKYGSAWCHEILPVEVVEYICDLFEVNSDDRRRVLKSVKNEHANDKILKAVFG